MKTNVLKYYIAALYLCYTFVTFAQQPGTDDNNSGLEGADPAAPIDDYVWVLAAIGLVYVYFRVRTFALKGSSTKE